METTEPGPASRRKNFLRLGLLVLVACGAGALLVAGSPAELVARLQELTVALGPLGVPAYAAAFGLAAALLAPFSILGMGAGFLFGLGWGMVATFAGGVVGACLAFFAARYAARDLVHAWMGKHPLFRALDDAVAARGGWIILLLRLSPAVPYNVSNYLYGMTGVRFPAYLLASGLGLLPISALYAYLGAAGRAGLQAVAGKASHSPFEYAVFGLGLLATVAVTVVLGRVARDAVRAARAERGAGR